ncbi:N-methyl-D-aspartate receptor-associated protein [Cardiosporidium cionae]|uniref:N-methyl-D-aspartate receptor-associated protein n=1 Tax=Cardiosporidium cionae TaxID=476202 RepID=A0ABQ7J3Y0_9APIC|nr:N-methyl-D-aspartate receptor-associated protein [Cardiosporidium cionae]|eukprot:KAF8817812.1 N-methyl-D-aspartate receptor-associated protein [Cardiosporidium cionae]
MNPNSYYADDYAYGSRRSPNPSGASGYSHAHRADNYNDPSSQRADYETFPPPQAASSHRDDYAQNNAMPAGGNAYPPENPNGDGYDHESQSYYSSDKLTAACDVSIRHGFIRKVFSIVGIQLLFTFSVSLPFLLIASWGSFLILNYTWLLIIAFILVIVPMIVLSCFRGISRSFPQNYIMLFLLTFGMTIIVSIAGSVTAASSFAIAAGITAAVSIGLIIFAIQTRIDFTTNCWWKTSKIRIQHRRLRFCSYVSLPGYYQSLFVFVANP